MPALFLGCDPSDPTCSLAQMTEVLDRVRKEMLDRLEQIESELAEVEPLIAERAEIERVLSTHPFDAVEASPAT